MNDYESFKKAYSQGTDAQKESRERRFGNNENYRNFKAQWEQEQNPQPQLSNPAPVQNQFQNQTFDGGSTYNNQVQNNQNNDQRQPSYDPNEVLDQSRFTDPNAQVRVQEGNARQTGQPDYEDDSDARMNEITNNLNAYWNTNREYFSDRATFNRIFSYDKRSKAQQAHFDGFWKRKELEQKVAGYSDGKAVSMALEEGTLTKSQLEALKVQNPKVYNEYLQDQLKKKQLDLVNTDSPSRIFNEDEQISHNTDALTDMMRKLGFDMSADGRAKELYDKFKELKTDPKIDAMKQDYLEARKIYLQRKREFNQIPDKVRAQSSWASDTLIEARINKAQRLAYWELQSLADEAQIRKEEYVLEYGEMKDEFNAFKMQADEDYRAFTSKMSSLWFAKGLLGFETPEQQRQGQLRQQKDLNDLNLQFAKDKANLESDLTNINSKDPQTQRTALMKALDQYYKDFWSIILRPQAQVVDDILALAKKEGISVGEAMRKNFTDPLQKKDGYKKLMNKQYGISNERPKDVIGKWDGQDVILRYDNNGHLSIVGANFWSSSSGYQWPAYTPVSTERMQAWLQQLLAQGDGSKGGQCGYFVNNYLQGLWIGRLFTDPISAKKTVVNSSTPTIGSVAVIDRSDNPNSSEAQKKYGHVGVVTKINADGSVVLKQSNKNGEEKVFTSTYRANQIYGYFDPTKGATNGTGGFDQTNIPLYEAYLTEGKLPSDAKIKAMWGLKKFTNEAQAYAVSMGGDIESKAQKEEIMKLRKEFNGTTEAKNFATIKQQYDGLKASANLKTPAGDIALIFGYMKMLDPNSVVREGEFATAQNAGGIDEKIRNAYNKAKNGTRLQDSQRRDFVKNAEALYNSYAKQYNTRLEEYKSYSIEWGNVNRIGTEAVTAGYKFSSQGWVQNTQSLSETVNYSKMQSIAPKSNHSSNYTSLVGGMR